MAVRATGYREIPFNYTSADDARVVALLLGDGTWARLEELRARRVTGRSARLLMRFLGEVFIHRRNAYLFEELLASPKRQAKLLGGLEADLGDIEAKAAGEPVVGEILAACRGLLGRFVAEIRETKDRGASGVRVMALDEGERVVAFERVPESDTPEGTNGPNSANGTSGSDDVSTPPDGPIEA